MRTCVRMAIACAYLPRFELVVAVGGAEALAGRPLAIAPSPGMRPCVGEVSGAAEGRGVRAGMPLGEALARCPELGLVPGDPLGVREAWERTLDAIESIGAAVEQARPGLAYFGLDGLRRCHGGDERVVDLARRALQRPVRMGIGPTRLCALRAALQARSRRTMAMGDRQALRSLRSAPVSVLGFHEQTAALVEPLELLGLHTLGELVALGRDALADRFGEAGVAAHRMASGEERPLLPRRVEDRMEESLELWQASSGRALEGALGVLVGRLLARPGRRGRSLRGVTLYAGLVEGGTWSERVVFRQPLSDHRRMCLALELRLALLPAPARTLRLRVDGFGPVAGSQVTLLDEDLALKRARLIEAVRQVRLVAGREGALRAVLVDGASRVPERRVVLVPFGG
jgi:nucleotidyltransferase/DNA polymerase involved in DNA repair